MKFDNVGIIGVGSYLPKKVLTNHTIEKTIDTTHEWINIKLGITAYYNPSQTNKTPSQIQQIVTQTVLDYDEKYLKNFNGVFRHSQLSRLIDTSDVSIVNNTMTVVLNGMQVVLRAVGAWVTVSTSTTWTGA